METMDLGEFFWWCGFIFCMGAGMTLGGLFGVACYDFMKGVLK
jgi:hypothetical protein